MDSRLFIRSLSGRYATARRRRNQRAEKPINPGWPLAYTLSGCVGSIVPATALGDFPVRPLVAPTGGGRAAHGHGGMARRLVGPHPPAPRVTSTYAARSPNLFMETGRWLGPVVEKQLSEAECLVAAIREELAALTALPSAILEGIFGGGQRHGTR